ARASLEWASRQSLSNHSDFSIFRFNRWEYTSNDPINAEQAITTFENNRALISEAELLYKPWLKFRKYNGMLRPVDESSPEFRLLYRAGWQNVLESTTDFQQIELGLKTEFAL